MSEHPLLKYAYVQWLGIKETDNPDYYQLLGLRQGETNRVVIANAARNRSVLVRRYQATEQADVARLLLHQITKAKACLSDERSRRAYDISLQVPSIQGTNELLLRDASGVSPDAAAPSVDLPPPRRRSRTWPWSSGAGRRRRTVALWHWVAAICVAIAFCVFAYQQIVPNSEPIAAVSEAEEEQDDKPTNRQSTPTATIPRARNAAPSGGDSGRKKLPAQGAPRRAAAEESLPGEKPGSALPSAANTDAAPPIPDAVPHPPRVRSANPFGNLAEEVDLPSESGSGLTGDVKPFVSLGQTAGSEFEKWTVSLRRAFGGQASRRKFELRPVGQTEGFAGWNIFTELDAAAGDRVAALSGAPTTSKSVVVAQLVANDGELMLRCTGSHQEGWEELRCFQLLFAAGEHARAVQLRTTPQLPPITLTFDEKHLTVPLPIAPLPAGYEVRCEVDRLVDFPGGYALKPENGSFVAGETLEIRVEDVTIDVKLSASLELLTVDVAATYPVRGQRVEFVIDRVNNHLLGLQKKLAEDQQLLLQSQSAAVTLPPRMEYLASIARNSVALESVRANLEFGVLKGQLKIAQYNIRRLSRTIPATENSLQSVFAMAKLGQQLHGKAKLRLRIMAARGDEEFPIAMIGAHEIGPFENQE